MKNFKQVKYLLFLFIFFAFNTSASVLDSNSSGYKVLTNKVIWTYSSDIWLAKGNSSSIYSPNNALMAVDNIISADKSINNIIGNIPSNRITASFLIKIVYQLSVDVFVQSNKGMNDYKNLLTGVDTTFTVSNEYINNDIDQISLVKSLNAAFSSFDIKTLDSYDVSAVPVPNAIWFFITSFISVFGLKKICERDLYAVKKSLGLRDFYQNLK